MNDEAGSPSSAAPPPSSSPRSSDDTPADDAPSNVNDESPSFYFSRKPRLLDLIAVLDRIVWLELVVIYLLDNSFIRFAFRAMVQAVYLMPKPKGFKEPNIPQPYVGGIIGTNVLCIILHIIHKAPSAGEGTRGYLHGSLILDFIGQQGPSSKLRILLLDIVILVVQIIAMAAVAERKELDSKGDGVSPQDHDAEERGEIRGVTQVDGDIEMQNLGESAALMDEVISADDRNTFASSDAIASGQAFIADFRLIDSTRSQYRAYQDRRLNQTQDSSDSGETAIDVFHELRSRLERRISVAPTSVPDAR